MTGQRFYTKTLKLFRKMKEKYPSTTTFYQGIRQHSRSSFSIHLWVESGEDGCEIFDASLSGEQWNERDCYYEVMRLDDIRPVIDCQNLVCNADGDY